MNVSQPSRITLEFVPAQGLPALNRLEIRLLDAVGQACGKLRFAEKSSSLPIRAQQEVQVEK